MARSLVLRGVRYPRPSASKRPAARRAAFRSWVVSRTPSPLAVRLDDPTQTAAGLRVQAGW